MENKYISVSVTASRAAGGFPLVTAAPRERCPGRRRGGLSASSWNVNTSSCVTARKCQPRVFGVQFSILLAWQPSGAARPRPPGEKKKINIVFFSLFSTCAPSSFMMAHAESMEPSSPRLHREKGSM